MADGFGSIKVEVSMSNELLMVGDTVVTKTFMGESEFLITRTTKTKALSERESDGYEHSFQRFISSNMAYPYEQWNTTKYRVVRATQK